MNILRRWCRIVTFLMAFLSNIKSVEVIQNPGATYDASVNAVIKIKTIKKKGEGFGFDTRSVYWCNKHDNTIQQVNMNYRHNGQNLFATYKFSDASWMQKPSYEQTVHVDTLWQQHNNNEVTGRLNRPIFMGNFNNAFSLPCGITLNVDYRYQSKGNTMNVYLAKEQHVLDVSISKSFLKDALTLEIKGNDLLYKCWDANLLYNQKMELLQVSKRGTRDLQLTLRYKFNTTRSKYKGTGAGNAELNRL